MNHLFRKAAVAAAVATASVGSFAATIVDTWDYTIDAFWTGATFDNSAGRAGASTWDEDTVAWSDTQGNTSSLAINGNPATGTVTTNGMYEFGQTLVHTNEVLFGARTLRTADMTANLTLKANDGTGTVELDPLAFTIRFKETPNVANCGFSSVSNCDDIFVLQAGSLKNSFVHNGVSYYTDIVTLNPSTQQPGVLVLSDEQCALAGAASGCLGFTTRENAQTPMTFGFRVVAGNVPAIPEPSTYALMALGLVGVVAMRRRNARRD